MDVIGGFSLALLVALAVGAQAWGIRDRRRRARQARAWAATVDWIEVAANEAPPGMPIQVRRDRTLPAFRARLEGRPLAVVPVSSRPRYGYLWALCTTAPRTAPVLVASRLDFGSWNLLDGHISGWVRAEISDPEFSREFLVQLPIGASADDALPEQTRRLLLEARPHVWCWNVRPDGVAVLWTRESYGASPASALEPAVELLGKLTIGAIP